jgi:hypothetical protein
MFSVMYMLYSRLSCNVGITDCPAELLQTRLSSLGTRYHFRSWRRCTHSLAHVIDLQSRICIENVLELIVLRDRPKFRKSPSMVILVLARLSAAVNAKGSQREDKQLQPHLSYAEGTDDWTGWTFGARQAHSIGTNRSVPKIEGIAA